MATKDVPFTVTNGTTQAIVAQGTFSVDDATNEVVVISGTVGGQTISALSNFNGANNVLQKEFMRTQVGAPTYTYRVGSVSFEAGGVSYNLNGPGAFFPGRPFEPTRLISSDGNDIVVGLNAGSYVDPLCFTTGTKISTARGEMVVEDLRVGDLAVTAAGALRPIVWIGHREITAKSGSLAFNQQPVRVRAGASGRGLPSRDLFLSPGHPVLVGADADNAGGVLVPVMCLINGTTVTREPVASVTYWHVELDSHDILLAEGLPAESYIDGGDRAFFSEASDHALHNPDFVAPGWNGRCRPVAVDGPVVEAERLRLDAVFSGSLSEQCEWEPARLWCEPVSIA
ncbi:Hint domain-containing protein [Methylobacterium sp. R2-1]|uniref:Hint domain-containing protein n=1 Tax=Methylobacterium sp. R2-1 TaxID=2587064 RepID=UPI00180ACF3E|nr:Hint domain-containing protein [Methylobacterium sp. R2-1]MBB2959831.1 hypothetical protein [Methylobacterium sp. R2-1]